MFFFFFCFALVGIVLEILFVPCSMAPRAANVDPTWRKRGFSETLFGIIFVRKRKLARK